MHGFGRRGPDPRPHLPLLAGGWYEMLSRAFTCMNTSKLQKWVPYYTEGDGRPIYDLLLTHHRAVYPEYCKELDGISHAANVSFTTLFLLNLADVSR